MKGRKIARMARILFFFGPNEVKCSKILYADAAEMLVICGHREKFPKQFQEALSMAPEWPQKLCSHSGTMLEPCWGHRYDHKTSQVYSAFQVCLGSLSVIKFVRNCPNSKTVRKRAETFRKQPETVRNRPRTVCNRLQPSETVRKRSETVRNCPKQSESVFN